jgi:hypothetical protein
MSKERFSLFLSEDNRKYIDSLSKKLGVSKSVVVNVMCSMVGVYFSDEQVGMEVGVHKPKDGRSKDATF